ncbi:MAG: ribonuclease III [Mariprofundales bacterium]
MLVTDIKSFEQRIAYHFDDIALLERALTHSSTGEKKHMERLEFLGDAVLDLVIAELLFQRFPNHDEGCLTRMRAQLVRKESLKCIADLWDIAPLLYVGAGERENGNIRSSSIASNAVEAILGAIYLDANANLAAVKKCIITEWEVLMTGLSADRDAKSRLQEYTQERCWGLPSYQTAMINNNIFHAVCYVCDQIKGEGHGRRKKIAEQLAAKQALDILESN